MIQQRSWLQYMSNVPVVQRHAHDHCERRLVLVWTSAGAVLYRAVLCCDMLCCSVMGWPRLCWAMPCCAVLRCAFITLKR